MARKIANYATWTDEEWQEYRQQQHGIGGSDIATILGVNPYKSARRLWAELSGLMDREDISGKMAVKMGHKLEPVVAELFTEETGLKVRKNNFILQHDIYDYMYANIDREVILPDGEKAVLEIKTAGSFSKSQWQGDKVPMQYMAQVQYYLAITGLQKAYMAVLIGGQEFEWWTIDRNEETIKQIEEAAADFWHCVETGNEPETDGSEDTAKLLMESYTDSNDSTIDLSESDYEKFELRDMLQDQKKEIETDIRAIDNYFKDQIGKANALAAVCKDRYVKWGFSKRKQVDEKALAMAYPALYEEYQKACNEFTTFKESRRINY
jgi:putative phage-type endonuclease